MIIACPECSKKFQVPDNAIPKEGRTVQCSSCSHEWKQYPLKKPKVVQLKEPSPIVTSSVTKVRKVQKKAAGPAPYSKEYMEQKWGSTVKNYAEQKGISKKKTASKKIKKTKSAKLNEKNEKPSFGFFNYIITYSIGITFLVGILNFERARLSRKFPALEPYIDNFFETINNLKIFILDFYR